MKYRINIKQKHINKLRYRTHFILAFMGEQYLNHFLDYKSREFNKNYNKEKRLADPQLYMVKQVNYLYKIIAKESRRIRKFNSLWDKIDPNNS